MTGFKERLKAGGPVIVMNPDRRSPSLVEFIGKLITIEEAAHRLKELFRGERWCGIFQTDDNILG